MSLDERITALQAATRPNQCKPCRFLAGLGVFEGAEYVKALANPAFQTAALLKVMNEDGAEIASTSSVAEHRKAKHHDPA